MTARLAFLTWSLVYTFSAACQSLQVDTVNYLEYSAGYITPAALRAACIADDYIYFPLSVENNTLKVHQHNSRTGTDSLLLFNTENTSLDPRFAVRGIIKHGDRIATWSNCLLEYEISSGKLIGEINDPDITEARYGGGGVIVVSHLYFEDTKKRQLASIHVHKSRKESAKVRFDADHFELTRFNPNHLFDANERYILRCSVSLPKVFLYDHDLKLLDTLSLNIPDWNDVSKVINAKLMEDAKAQETDFFSFYFKLFDEGISKNLSIRFIDKDTALIVFLLENKRYQYQLIHIGQNDELTSTPQPVELPNAYCLTADTDSHIPKNLCFPGLLLASAWPSYHDSTLQFVTWGFKGLPYGITCGEKNEILNTPNLDQRQWLHLYRIKLQMP